MRRLAFVLCLVALGGCKSGLAKIEGMRDDLVADRVPNVTSFQACSAMSPVYTPSHKAGPYDAHCLSAIANTLGSKVGYVQPPTDHASAATAAVVLLRDGRGDYLVHGDAWMADIKDGKGVGHDVLRLAIAKKLVDAGPALANPIEDEAAASNAIKAIVAAIPGVCPAYWVAASNDKTAPAELSADNAACVQRDLTRPDGPGGLYGTGTFRALEGAIALMKDTARTLRAALPNMEPASAAAMEKKLAVIEPMTKTVRRKRLPQTFTVLKDAHAHADAGVPIAPPSGDAGK